MDDLSNDLAALLKRADLAIASARLLINENDVWRQRVVEQFDHMLRLGTEVNRNGSGDSFSVEIIRYP